jgi:hypothetical protein
MRRLVRENTSLRQLLWELSAYAEQSGVDLGPYTEKIEHMLTLMEVSNASEQGPQATP